MSSSIDAAKADGPGSLFLRLWRQAASWDPTTRAGAPRPTTPFKQRIASLLAQDDDAVVLRELNALLSASGPSDPMAVMAVLQGMDAAFMAVHPRYGSFAPSVAARPDIPAWLEDLQSIRSDLGYYSAHDDLRLIPRGPLLRTPRDPGASNADSLEDRFTALSAVRLGSSEAQRQVTLEMLVFDTDRLGGVRAPARKGRESVLFVPVAEAAEDIVQTERVSGDRRFLDLRPSAGWRPADRFAEAIRQALASDIAFAPEFVMPEDQSDRVAAAIASMGIKAPNLTLAGSGLTTAMSGGRPWNELRAMNSAGRVLWRQRKIWPAGVKDAAGPPGSGLSMEDTSSGDTLCIADLAGFGRCVVLICQDISAYPLADDVVRWFQPDWVFTPIMDTGATPGRWAHQITFAHSANSRTRFLVACSTSMCRWGAGGKEEIVGLAVGPRDDIPPDGDIEQGRRVAAVRVDPGSTPGHVRLVWTQGSDWTFTTLAAPNGP